MQCGISTSCFYPQETAEALSALRGAGVETVEIFLNTFSELELSYTERLRSVLQDAGMRAAALHPFTSGMETFFFASEYGGRLEDGLRIYRRYFEICRVLGIPRVVFHGDYSQTPFPFRAAGQWKNLPAPAYASCAAAGRPSKMHCCPARWALYTGYRKNSYRTSPAAYKTAA